MSSRPRVKRRGPSWKRSARILPEAVPSPAVRPILHRGVVERSCVGDLRQTLFGVPRRPFGTSGRPPIAAEQRSVPGGFKQLARHAGQNSMRYRGWNDSRVTETPAMRSVR